MNERNDQNHSNGSALNKHTLVLASTYQPIQVIATRHAVELLYRGAAKVIGSEDVDNVIALYQPFDWMEWANACRTLNGRHEHALSHIGFIHGTNGFRILRPSVLYLRHFHQLPLKHVHLTRRNIHIRDGFTCQYCGDKPGTQRLNVDHVIPLSRGGKTSWDNLVSSCYSCNSKKEDMTPQKAGMTLKKKPKKMHWFALMRFRLQVANHKYPDWKPFLQQYIEE